MADPTGWLTPVTSWTPTTGINTTALNRIEKNIELLKGRVWGKDGTFDARANTPYFSTAVVKTINYSVINKTVFLNIPADFISPAYTENTELQLEPVTTWPADIIPSTARRAPCIFKNNGQSGNHSERPGYMMIPNTTSANIVCYIVATATVYYEEGFFGDDGFYIGGGNSLKKGIPIQTVSYMLETAP